MPYDLKALGLRRWRSRVPQIADDVFQIVGQIIVHWAQVEFDLDSTLSIAAGVPWPIARLTFTDPRSIDKLRLIRETLQVRGLKPPAMKRLIRAVQIGERDRNVIAHSVWASHPDTGKLHIRIAAGKWSTEDRHKGLHGMIGKTPRKAMHQAQPFTTAEGNQALKTILLAERLVTRLHFQVRRLVPSLPKFPEPQ